MKSEKTTHPKRMSSEARKRYFIEKAVIYFANEGFEGGTRKFARSIGVTQPLLFRYFASKEELVHAVYEEVYLSQWKPEWVLQIKDRSQPVSERLERFYKSFTGGFDRVWMRIFLFAALNDIEIHRDYLMRITKSLLIPICEEMRHEIGVTSELPITEREHTMVWNMHGAVFHEGIRQHLYGFPPTTSPDDGYLIAIRMYLEDARRHVAEVVAAQEQQGKIVDFDPLIWKHLL